MRIERHNPLEELLEELWVLREGGSSPDIPVARLTQESKIQPADETMDKLLEKGLIERKDGTVSLTETGETRASGIVRRNRLTAVLLSQIFELRDDEVEEAACEFEHILSPTVTESICTFMGHPPEAPSGLPIPPGECCRLFKKDVKPLVTPLDELPVGGHAKIVFIAPRYHTRIDKLGALGLVPGKSFRLHQKKPTYVLEIGETTLALDDAIAREIYVKPVVIS